MGKKFGSVKLFIECVVVVVVVQEVVVVGKNS